MWWAQQAGEKNQKRESHSKARGSIRETPKTVTRETCVPMHHMLLHLSRISSVSRGVFSGQFKAAEAAGQRCSWQHAEEDKYNTQYLLCQMRCFQAEVPDMDGSAHLVLAYSDCFYTNEPPGSQTASHTFNWTFMFNWTCQLDISSLPLHSVII